MLLSLAACPTEGQVPSTSVEGTWALVPPVESGRSTIRTAFDRALADANFFLRALARERVDPDQLLARRIVVRREGDRMTTTMVTTGAHRFRTRLGYPETVRGENGEDLELTQSLTGDSLQLYFRFDEGRRWTVLRPEGDRMRAFTTIDPRRLDDDVHFVLAYRRVR